jgi:uncharacterized protein YqgV (UPF0045/DUF77 family)
MVGSHDRGQQQRAGDLGRLVAILKRLESPQQKMEAKMDANQEIMEAKVDTVMNSIQERMEAMIKTSHEEIIAEMKAGQIQIKAGLEGVKADQKKMEAAISFILSELEETMKNRVEDVLSSADQWRQDLREELNAKIEGM